MQIKPVPILIISCLLICLGGLYAAETEEAFFTVELPLIDGTPSESIEIPNGRPAYAILVSGYLQNYSFDMFHYYNFAKCLLEKGAYVHYAWWNNLLAPYMRRPLHDPMSEPGLANLATGDYLGFLPIIPDDPNDPTVIHKAIPGNDFQFQADVEALITAIRENNPHAAIILVGHSMGGDAVARLGASTIHDIDLLAPIDPVGNRSCTPWTPLLPDVYQCQGLVQWTRFRATHDDWFILPPRRAFGSNIKYLYHRWQQEGMPPIDFLLPLPYPLDTEYTFIHPETRVLSIGQDSNNVQSMVDTSWSLFIPFSGVDGHGEIVGFQGLDLLSLESNPLALRAQNWPSRPDEDSRVSILQAWESDPTYLETNDHAPTNPELCLVSGDLCTIFEIVVNLPPAADAGPDQIIECAGPDGTAVMLDGSGSTDPNDDPLTYTWIGPFGTLTGETLYTDLPLGTHSITLTVDDGRGKSDSDTVDITAVDSTPPSLSLSLSPNVLWPPNHRLITITASIAVSDVCDASPSVELVSIISNEPDNGPGGGNSSNDIQGASFGTDDRTFRLRAERSGMGRGRIYTVTYEAMDASGNVADATDWVTVLHDHGDRAKPGKRAKKRRH